MTRTDRTFLIASGIAMALVALIFVLAGITLLRALFIGINVATLLAYGYDKHVAASRGVRIPEFVLHVMAAAGGTPGAFAGQQLFRHKTRKSRFRTIFFMIAGGQALLLVMYAMSR